MSITGLRKITVFNPDNGDVAQFNDVKKEGQLNLAPLDADEDTTGGIPYAGDESTLEAVLYDLGASEAQVKSWMNDNKRIRAVGLGHQVNFLWTERDRVRIIRPDFFAPGNRKYSTLTMLRKGGQHKIDHLVNLLHNDDLVLDEGGNVKRIIFPIEGAKLTLSRDFGASPLDGQVTIRALDFAEQELEEVVGTNADGRTSATITLPSGTWFVECVLGASTGDPALRSDGKKTYIDE